MKRLGPMPQRELVNELRDAIDAVRITDPLHGPSPSARLRLRRMIRENPEGVQTHHIQHNIGRHRSEWLAPLIEAELGL